FTTVKEKVQGKGITSVLPEGTEERILGAAERLAKEELVKQILVGNREEISEKAASMNLTLEGVDIYDTATYEEMDAMVA
ncbi:phosphate acyltransferase, partial [Bacillus cereus]|uniref:phosphate acyltransferase n=1 Tax=Bacillus cereus TaxID=1396 RepID=UPI002112E6BB|nr:phosphate acyltransferase [Bacillus cereus]